LPLRMHVPRRASAAPLTLFTAGALLAGVASGGIVEERVSSGNPAVALVANAFVTFVAILVLALVQRRVSLSVAVVLPQAAGALCGIAFVHLALRLGFVAAPPWLSERPPQLVNDAVAVFSTLAVVWACASRLDARLLAAALLALTAYRVTSQHWHLDLAPHGFLLSVQDLVIAQVVAVALALPVYRGMTRDVG
jgi:hypothetical protein